MARISVLMGIYNCAATLADAIDSILNQTYTDWELILCDDGSTDNTYQIAREYLTRYPSKIKLISNEMNMGLNYSLNRCLEISCGKYIARQDGDDISLPTRFEKEIAALEADPSLAVVSCPMIYFDESGDWATGTTSVEYPTKNSLVHSTPHCHGPCMIRTEVLRLVGGYSVGKRLLRVEDRHLWMKIYATGAYGRNLSEPLYKMRDNREATNRRRLRYRFNSAYVIIQTVKTLKLPKKYYIYALKPVLVGLLPKPIYSKLHKWKLSHQG